MDKKLTVLLPCYNHEQYVAEAIESVLAQTYQNFDFVVVDNGSTDNSLEVIWRYRDKITKIVHLEKNNIRTVWDALLDGVHTEYIALMTSDDFWTPDKLEKQIQALEERPECGACFSWAEHTDEKLNPVTRPDEVFMQENRTRCEWLRKFFLEGNCLAFPSAVIRTKLWDKIHDKCAPYWQLGDFIIWIKLLQLTNIYIFPEILVKFRAHGNNISLTNRNTRKSTLNEYNHIFYQTYSGLTNEDFIKIFEPELTDKNVNKQNDRAVTCEKILVLFKLADKYGGEFSLAAVSFFYENYSHNGMEEMMESQYSLSFEELQSYCQKYGYGSYAARLRLSEEFVCNTGYSSLNSNIQEVISLAVQYLRNTNNLTLLQEKKDVLSFLSILDELEDNLRINGLSINFRQEEIISDMEEGRTEWIGKMKEIGNRLLQIENLLTMLKLR